MYLTGLFGDKLLIRYIKYNEKGDRSILDVYYQMTFLSCFVSLSRFLDKLDLVVVVNSFQNPNLY